MKLDKALCPFCNGTMYLENNDDGTICAYCKACNFELPTIETSFGLEYCYEQKNKLLGEYIEFTNKVCEIMNGINLENKFKKVETLRDKLEIMCEKKESIYE